MSFKLSIDEFHGQSICDVMRSIEIAYRKPISQLRLFDLLVNERTGKALRHGAYMFFNESNECIYIGMCSSSHFAHRIGGHFGMSPKYGMNTFLKRAVKMLGFDGEYSSYVKVLPEISNYGLLIIDASGRGKDFVKGLEKSLHILYKPALNFPKGYPSTYKTISLNTDFISFITNGRGRRDRNASPANMSSIKMPAGK